MDGQAALRWIRLITIVVCYLIQEGHVNDRVEFSFLRNDPHIREIQIFAIGCCVPIAISSTLEQVWDKEKSRNQFETMFLLLSLVIPAVFFVFFQQMEYSPTLYITLMNCAAVMLLYCVYSGFSLLFKNRMIIEGSLILSFFSLSCGLVLWQVLPSCTLKTN